MIAEFFNFEGCIAVRLYYKDSNKALRSHLDVKDVLDKYCKHKCLQDSCYSNYNITGTSRYEAITPVFMTGNVEVATVVDYYTDIQF